ncbi:50S ribosomal protein L4 [Melia azedarach]|uniref:50S ribosomal protein L4 n=1 Tax=Melia azedarach TaxID=155640 RepID=A0ACC1X6J1_MELAZ|nr:50S ribosomal protein L4 [Melia azedarach]
MSMCLLVDQQGTQSTKTISDVSGTGRKPWRQKGTGRARHGTLRGPQFRGGATMHGPKPRSHAIKLNKRVRRLGLKIALSARAAEGKVNLSLTLTYTSPQPESNGIGGHCKFSIIKTGYMGNLKGCNIFSIDLISFEYFSLSFYALLFCS